MGLNTPPSENSISHFDVYIRNYNKFSLEFSEMVDKYLHSTDNTWADRDIINWVIQASKLWPDIDSDKQGISIAHYGFKNLENDMGVDSMVLNVMGLTRYIVNVDDATKLGFVREVSPTNFVVICGYLHDYFTENQLNKEIIRQEVKKIINAKINLNTNWKSDLAFILYTQERFSSEYTTEIKSDDEDLINSFFLETQVVFEKLYGEFCEFMSDQLFDEMFIHFFQFILDFPIWNVDAKKGREN